MTDKIPTAVAVASSNSTIIKDSDGRELHIKKLNTLEGAKLTRACGDAASNQPYMIYATLAASVRQIDDTPMQFPKSVEAVESLIGRLDDAGMEAVARWAESLAPQNQDDVWAAAKN
ncbi:MAG: hypothetical protein Q7J26_02535 [Brevundimonas sp.]|uniref:hypothetical protein n=1 Tax=Brevundimonas sp. TaxID=1871086 RepID=UPI002728066D|nr:hypothetical protein [Brevundimonas sp.]MDO9607376.1 hypothetical protein [Brevundimonas sp.]